MEDHCQSDCLHVRERLFGAEGTFATGDVVESFSFFVQLHKHNTELLGLTLNTIKTGTHCRTDDHVVAEEIGKALDTIGEGDVA
jgi:hypothetical protein